MVRKGIKENTKQAQGALKNVEREQTVNISGEAFVNSTIEKEETKVIVIIKVTMEEVGVNF